MTGGRIDKRKNIHKLLRAVSELNEPKIKLILIGVPNKEMTETINTLLDPKYARAIGWVNPDSIYDYFLASDLGVFPGTHSVLWEQAVGTGLPCIFHEWPGMTHVDIGGNCVFIKNGDKVQSRKLLHLYLMIVRRMNVCVLSLWIKVFNIFIRIYHEKAIGL